MERMSRSTLKVLLRIYKPGRLLPSDKFAKHLSTVTAVRTSPCPLYLAPVCTECHNQQLAYFHTTQDVAAKKHSKRTLKAKKVSFKKEKAGEVVAIATSMTVKELANTLNSNVDHVLTVLPYTSAGTRFIRALADTAIEDIAIIKEVVEKSGYRWRIESKKKTAEKENKDAVRRPPPDPGVLVKRPPIVTIMGHVDHGKTTLLDALRHSNVVAQEFGGITQHIGAFSVRLPGAEETITFLDTPGHAAFSAMRARGAHATDIVVLVVAADDGVMKQTVESLQHARDSHVPIVVAINKCDKAEADVEASKQELTQHGLMSEDLGGDTQVIPISALKGTHLDVLQEAILAQAELLELSCDVAGLVEGVVIESSVQPGRGKLSTILVQRGTLKKGSYLVAGLAHAKVRGMFNDQGRPVQEAPPGTAVEVIGWRELPSAGDLLLEVETEHRAREVMHWREEQARSLRSEEELLVIQARIDSHDREYREKRRKMLEMGVWRARRLPRSDRRKEEVVEHEGPEVAIVLKGDVDGSVEAILDVIDSYTSDQCRLHMLSYGVGDVSEHDVEMAAAFNGELFAFNVKSAERLVTMARSRGVTIHHHNVIYRLMDVLRDCLQRKLPPVEVEEIIGEANVQQAFMITEGKHKVPVAGCLCIKGQLLKKKRFRLMRDGEEVMEGAVSSLKHFKNEVDTIKTDVECGVCFQDKHTIPVQGDTVICYEKKKQKQILQWDLDF